MINSKLSKTITLRISKKTYQKLQKYSKKTSAPHSLIVRKWLIEKLKSTRIP